MQVSVQVSVYPLGQTDLAPAIEAMWRVFQQHQLVFHAGTMSTVLEGDDEQVFTALCEAFRAAAQFGAAVMAATVSNACPRVPVEESEG